MPVSVEELREIEDNAGAARFIHTNLHIHTPATPWDWDKFPNQTKRASSLTPQDYFDALSRTSLELAAVTDHNCIKWCKPLIELAQAGRRNGTCRLHILPGVELTTYEGPHVVALFDEDKDLNEIQNMLIRLGMSGEGDQNDLIACMMPEPTITIAQAFSEIDSLGGVVVAPHVHNKDGLWGPKDFRGRTDILNDPRLRILAAPSGHIKRVKEQGRVRLLYKNMDTTIITNSFAFINISDCHRLDDFELNTTWLKMSEPSLDGVKQVIYEPELRVSHELQELDMPVENPTAFLFCQPVEATHPYLIGVAVTGGMLDGQKIGFSPHQNSLIGKNYAGKSAVIDCLRFALDATPQDDEAYFRYVDRLRGILTEGGQIRLYLRGCDGRTYGISRTLSCTKVPRTRDRWCLEGAPEVYSLWDEEFHRESDVPVETILHIEVYPQGEVVKIKDNAARQMTIVDALAKLEDEIEFLTSLEIVGEKTLLGKLQDNSADIIELVSQRDEIAEEIAGIGQLEDEIEDLQRLIDSPLFDKMQGWTHLGVLVDQYCRLLSTHKDDWSLLELVTIQSEDGDEKQDDVSSDQELGVDSPRALDAESQDLVPSTASVDQFKTEVHRCFNLARQELSDLRLSGIQIIDESLTRLVQLEEEASKRLDEVKVSITETLPAGEEDARTSLVERIAEKKLRLNSLKARQSEKENAEKKIGQLEQQRRTWITEYSRKWQAIRERRFKIVELLDTHSADNIKAELREEVEFKEYRELLDEIADRLTSATNKISRRQDQLDTIATNVTPEQLIQVVKSGDSNRLIELAPDVTSNTARVILGMGTADIHSLEVCVLHDRLVISYRKEGDREYTPIDSGLSGGEQALALVSVAMVPKDFPLVIDQPEDELGPALITVELVEQIRLVKPVRPIYYP